jgi:hypothetical protein
MVRRVIGILVAAFAVLQLMSHSRLGRGAAGEQLDLLNPQLGLLFLGDFLGDAPERALVTCASIAALASALGLAAWPHRPGQFLFVQFLLALATAAALGFALLCVEQKSAGSSRELIPAVAVFLICYVVPWMVVAGSQVMSWLRNAKAAAAQPSN